MVRARRSLSQNFLVDRNLRRKIVDALQPDAVDHVLEVGPGHGELSELMVGRVRRLVMVEKDDRLVPLLRERWADRPDVRIVHADALDTDLDGLLEEGASRKLISNVPYSITSPLVFRLLDLEATRIVVMVQEEVARRICSPPGNRTYGALSVGVQVQARPRLAFRVGRGSFRPVPGVDSAVVVIEPRSPAPDRAIVASVRTLARECFSRRRKQLQRILRSSPEYGLEADEAHAILGRLGIDPAARPEQLAPEQFVTLARCLSHPGPGDPLG